jgi:hypothetical protein
MGFPIGACGRGAGVPNPKLMREIILIFSGQTKTRRSGFLSFLDPVLD